MKTMTLVKVNRDNPFVSDNIYSYREHYSWSTA
jgi:hypothetical protein